MEDMPPRFRFYPTEEELVSFYLYNMLEGKQEDLNTLSINRVIPVVDIYEFNPWDLPSYLCHRDPEQWFFFIPRKESEARGGRPKRLTDTGYWKAAGSPGFVYALNGGSIGVNRTMDKYPQPLQLIPNNFLLRPLPSEVHISRPYPQDGNGFELTNRFPKSSSLGDNQVDPLTQIGESNNEYSLLNVDGFWDLIRFIFDELVIYNFVYCH
ncbi:hypothetical protein CXB51_001377 [Gossypium anomalum]|uniref:NAC domain-containing protein n=1 Tax=Gossypium anomalum TaxID=47600 RepID=A0A8J6A2I3_9ROSI|nr:hypothetical protein CXB51_001377 [Gossypium anomalum]